MIKKLPLFLISSGEDCMTFHVFLFLLVVCLLLSLVLLWRLGWLPLQPSHSAVASRRSPVHRLLKPRTALDCPSCRLVSTPSSGGESAPAPVCPWPEVKSRRGAPKRVNTEGFACPNQQCPYFGITDARVHALVGDGKHGRAEQIQTFRCQACRTTFTARRHTPLYRLKTPSQQVAMVLTALAEGLDPSAAERVFGYRQATITTWLSRAARARSDIPRALFLSSPASVCPVGRTADKTAQRHTGPVAVVGHRPLYEDSPRSPSGSAHAKCGPHRDPFPPTDLGPWLRPAVHQ
jgi:transposase-like protein